MSVLLLLLVSAMVGGQSLLPLPDGQGGYIFPPEAPQAFLSYSLGDSEIDFFTLGSWTAEANLSLGYRWVPEAESGYRGEAYVPSVIQAPLLRNTVDLTLSLWIDGTWFFESSFRSGFQDNSILAGYYRTEGRFREFRVGTTSIGIAPMPGLDFSESAGLSPGLYARWELGESGLQHSTHELMLRYEQSSLVTRDFIGNREIQQERRPLSSWIRGRLFLLPDEEPEELEVWLRTSADRGESRDISTSGAWYRLLQEGRDYGLSMNRSLLRLSDNLENSDVIISYRKAGQRLTDSGFTGSIPLSRIYPADPAITLEPVAFSPDPGAGFDQQIVQPLNSLLGSPGLDLEDFFTELDNGRRYLALYRPGLFSPFEVAALYPSETPVDAIHLEGEAAYALDFSSSDGTVLLTGPYPPEPGQAPSLRYPLLSVFDRIEIAENYGPLGGKASEGSPVSAGIPVLLFSHTIGEGILINDEIVPGSLELYQNGLRRNDVLLEDGILRFSSPPSATDRISLRYRILDPQGGSSLIQAASGNSLTLAKGHVIRLAMGSTLALDPDTAVSSPAASPGSIQLGFGHEYSNEHLTMTSSARLQYGIPDSAAAFGPYPDFEDGNFLPLAEEGLFPASPPVAPSQRLSGAPAAAVSALTAAGSFAQPDRIPLPYRSYRQEFRGSLLGLYSPDGSIELPSVTEGVSGPFAARADAELDGFQGLIAGLELDGSAGSWTGYQIQPGGQESAGFISGFSLQMAGHDLSGPIHVFLQAGQLGEDLDGDGLLDAQESPDDTGFPFSPQGHPERLAAYPGRAWVSGWEGLSEDRNRNGILDYEAPGSSFLYYLGTLEAGDNPWTRFDLSFSSNDSSIMGGMPGAKILLLPDSPGSTGLILAGNQGFEVSPLRTEGAASLRGDTSAGFDAYRVSLESGQEGGVSLNMQGVPSSLYRQIDIPLLPGGLTGESELSIDLEGRELGSINISPGNDWQVLSIRLREQRVLLLDSSGNELAQSNISMADLPGELNILSLYLTPADDSWFSLGPPLLRGRDEALAGGAETRLSWTPHALTLWKGSPWETGLENLSIRQALYSTPEFSGDLFAHESSLTLRLAMLSVRQNQNIGWNFDSPPRIGSSTMIALRQPAPLSANLGYSRLWTEGVARESFSQESSLGISSGMLNGDIGYRMDVLLQNSERQWAVRTDLEAFSLLTLNLSAVLRRSESPRDPDAAGAAAPDIANGYLQDLAESFAYMDWTREWSPSFIPMKTAYEADLQGGLSIRSEAAGLALDHQLETKYSESEGDYRFVNDHGLQLNSSLGSMGELRLESTQTVIYGGIEAFPSWDEQVLFPYSLAAGEPFLGLPLYGAGLFSSRLDDQLLSAVTGPESILGNPYLLSGNYDLSLAYLRPLQFSWIDIAFPLAVEGSLTRTIQWNRGLEKDSRLFGFLAEWQALNMFGRLGRLPVFAFYGSDEWYAKGEWELNLSSPSDWRVRLSLEPLFTDAGPFDLIESQLSLSWAGLGGNFFRADGGLDLVWTRSLSWPAVEEFLEKEDGTADEGLILEHREKLSTSASLGGSAQQEAEALFGISGLPGAQILLTHESRLLLGDLGSAALSISGVYDRTPIPELNMRYVHTIGLKLSAILELSY